MLSKPSTYKVLQFVKYNENLNRNKSRSVFYAPLMFSKNVTVGLLESHSLDTYENINIFILKFYLPLKVKMDL